MSECKQARKLELYFAYQTLFSSHVLNLIDGETLFDYFSRMLLDETTTFNT